MRRRVLLIRSREFGWAELRGALDVMRDVAIVGDARNLAAADILVRDCQPDVIITAARLDDGLALSRLAVRRDDGLGGARIIVFTSHPEPADLPAMEALNVVGYLLWSDLCPELLPHCLATMLEGDVVLCSRGAAATFGGAALHSSPSRAAPVAVNARERAVLRHLVEGLTRQQIAQVEPLSLRTVDRIIATLQDKLDAPNQFTLGLAAARLGLARSGQQTATPLAAYRHQNGVPYPSQPPPELRRSVGRVLERGAAKRAAPPG